MMKQVSTINQINSMSFDDLLEMRAKVEAAINARIGEERRRLEASLERLNSISGAAATNSRLAKMRKAVVKRTLAPKYRNPANPKETWAGRGHRPRWLVAALKGGKKKLADFALSQGSKNS
jgi:DNA-binding protein H-NS